MRSEEWWKGRTIHRAPQYPLIKRFFKTLRRFLIFMRRPFTPNSSLLTPNFRHSFFIKDGINGII